MVTANTKIDKLSVDGLTMELVHDTVMRMVWVGDSTVETCRALRDYVERCRQESGEIGRNLIVIADEATGMKREARRELLPFARSKPWDRVAIVGGNFKLGVVVELLARAFSGLGMDIAELAFFASEAEARAWLDLDEP